MKKIIFFNHWRNGDIFTTRGMVQDIISQLGDENDYYYSHKCNPKITQDFINTFGAEDSNKILSNLDCYLKYGRDQEENYYINCWIGCWEDVWKKDPNIHHPNFNQFYSVFDQLYKEMEEYFGFNLKLKENILDYFPTIDYTKYKTKNIDKFIKDNKNIVLISNGNVMSAQSSVDNLHYVIEKLAIRFPKIIFVATEKISSKSSNVFFTSDIIGENCDLCEIAYLSESCKVLITKNSSPGSYFHTNKNINDPNKLYVSLSHKSVENLLHGVAAPIKYVFNNSTDNMFLVEFLSKIIKENYK